MSRNSRLRRRQWWQFLVIAVISAAVAGGWSYVVRREVEAAVVDDTRGYLERASTIVNLVRAEAQASLRSQCSVLSEDPRLKATLSTEGIDEATIADILTDLNNLRRSGFLLILTPDGRVRAQAGAAELRGLDLGSSSVVKQAQSATDPVIGAWVIADKLVDLCAVHIEVGGAVIAYLVVGSAMDQALLTAISSGTGVGVALVIGGRVAISVKDEKLQPVLSALAQGEGVYTNRTFAIDGQRYLSSMIELEQAARAQPRLAFVRPIAATMDRLGNISLILLVPPILVFIACLLVGWTSARIASAGRNA